MELRVRRLEIKEALSGSLALKLSSSGYVDNCAAVACVSQWTVFWIGRHSRHSLG